MTLTPDSSEKLFAEAATNWDLQKLYEDLAVAKRGFAPHKRRGLTETEKKHLRGLLCGYSPAEMAKKLHKSARGVEADLCSTIYRYVEQLTEQLPNTLKNWRDILEWLEQRGYKIRVSDAVDGEKAIASSPSEDIEALVQKVRSHFNETIQEECATLCTFNLLYTPMQGNLSRMYVQTKLNEFKSFGSSEFSQERQLWDEVVLRHPKLMVLGKPGAGKTTLLQYIALHCDKIEFQPKLVPVFINLKTLAENAKHPDKIDILSYIHEKYCRSKVSEQEIKTLLNHGRLLFLLDGLDEVTEEKIRDVNQTIHNFIDIYSDNRFIVSCRKGFQAYQSKKFTQFTFCKVADFGQPQRNAFIKQWFDEVPMIGQLKRSANANELIKRLDAPENQRIRELADTPLLLHLICLIFQEKGDLPSKRVDIYREAIDLLLEKWNLFNERLSIDIVELKEGLKSIAAITFEQGNSSFEEAEILPIIAKYPRILSTIEVSSGLIVKKVWKQYAFSHQTFQEYLIAENLVSSQQGWRTLLIHVTEPRWREIFFLAVEMVNDTNMFLQLFKQKFQDLIGRSSKDWWGEELFLINTDERTEKQDFPYHTDSEILEKLLIKVNQKLTDINKAHKALAIRAFYFMASLIISEVYSNRGEFLAFSSSIYDFSSKKILELIFDIDSQIYLILNTDNNCRIVSDIEIDYRLVLAFEIASQLANWCSFGNIEESDSAEVYHLNYQLDKTLYFNLHANCIKNYNLITSIQEFKNQLPALEENLENLIEWWVNQGGEWLEEFKDLIVEHRKIVHHWRFIDIDLEAAHRYYDINKLLVECLNSVCGVSDKLRSHIEDNLFLPVESSLS